MSFTTVNIDETLQHLENCNYIGAIQAIRLIHDLNRERSRLHQRVLDLEERDENRTMTAIVRDQCFYTSTGDIRVNMDTDLSEIYDGGKWVPIIDRNKPLTDQELLKMAADNFHYTEYKLAIEFARAIERTHGIGE